MARLLQEQGKTFREIAVILGKSKSTVHRWLDADKSGDENK
ncbi:helix-turn-helix domain-containing protein [Niabella sp. W65]|nr:helix-turn-helix domain-containing protein [Niabella sp. W65]MCH7362727.1 helix-turn-helix domain-containing protein [Niabella sp. W65]